MTLLEKYISRLRKILWNLCLNLRLVKRDGFDIGIKDFLTGSNGKKYKSPMFYKQQEKKLAKEQRCLSRKVKGLNNYERQRKVVGRIHIKTANQRAEHHWKLAVRLCRSFDVMIF